MQDIVVHIYISVRYKQIPLLGERLYTDDFRFY